MKNKLEWQSKQKYKFFSWMNEGEKEMKKNRKNLESNNFYVFLKVRRRIYFLLLLGASENVFSMFHVCHESQPTNYQHSDSVVFNIKFFFWEWGIQGTSRVEFYNPIIPKPGRHTCQCDRKFKKKSWEIPAIFLLLKCHLKSNHVTSSDLFIFH